MNEISREVKTVTNGNEDFQGVYISRQNYYRSFLQGPLHNHTLELMRILRERSYKAIIVYPEAVLWEPQQRPHHFLKEMAKRGYLCFFCETSTQPFTIREVEPNLFVLQGEAYLLSALRSQSVIVLCTWLMQMAWAELLPHKVLWYDILDCLELFSLYDSNMKEKHQQVL
ncbi:MAG: hypothetical protein K0Q73_8975, partial [Paenibacillus sp.]|nr:hypothetical protein [Paenibacillus sp.]